MTDASFFDYMAGKWCGECRYGVVENPPCCTQPDRWWVRKRGDQWTAIHPTLGVRGVVGNWAAAFGVAYRAAVKEAERG